MKKFILFSIAFGSLVVLIIGGACALEVGAEIVHYRRELQAPKETTVLVCGDSRTEMSLNPEFWPELFNFSVSGRPLDQGYLTAGDVLKTNPGQFRTLLLDVSPENAAIDLKLTMGEMEHGGKYLLIYFLHPHSGLRNWAGAFTHFRDLLVDRRLHLISRVIRGKRKFHSSLCSGYRKAMEQPKLKDLAKFNRSVERQYKHTKAVMDGEFPLDDYFRALDRLIDFARENGMEPVMLTAPWHPELRARVGVEKVRRFTDAVARHAELRKCRYFNMMEMSLPDQDWRDGNHLNSFGAEPFTKALRKCVQGEREKSSE